ncbi:MAG: leucyl aminopeptidase [bacterium]|nr:leucyl aminopeptidase [bacterium]
MKLSLAKQELASVAADVLMVSLIEGESLSGGALFVEQQMDGAISRLIEHGEFKSKLNEACVIYPKNAVFKKVVLVGLGEGKELSVEKVRQAAGSAFKLAVKGNMKSVAVALNGAGVNGVECLDVVQATVEGMLLANSRYEELKNKKTPIVMEEVILVANSECADCKVERAMEKGRIMADATNLARELVNKPANFMTPTHMANVAMEIAKNTGMTCTILGQSEMEKLEMGSMLGVAQGSDQPANIIVLKYEGNPGGETMAFVGKGLTFDSGGISLKPGDGMHLMKDDMGGGAAVLGAMQAIGYLKPKANVLGIVPCTENMPSGRALKPGDVVRAMTGKTIEIISTDAEGRLILADAVAYAVTLGANKIIDVATLTGACGIALGPIYSAIIANNAPLVQEILDAARVTGERFWQLPTDEEYKELIKSLVADIKNSGGRQGGTITGGLFIGEFVGETPWAHLDIAPTVYTETEKAYQPKGATGVAVRTLAELAVRSASNANCCK